MEENFPFQHFFKKDSTKNQILPTENIKDLVAPAEMHHSKFQSLDKEIKSILSQKLGEDKYESYLDNSFFIKNINDSMVNIGANTQYIKNKLTNEIRSELKAAIQECIGFSVEIKIELDTKEHPKLNNNPATAIRSAKDSSFRIELNETTQDLQEKIESNYLSHLKNNEEMETQQSSLIDPEKDFDNFVIGASNNLAYASALGVAKSPGKKYPSLYIYSHSGLGKTHLLHAIANKIKEDFPEMRICLITARAFLKEMIEYVRDKNISEFQRKYSEKVDVLMIDDIHELKKKPQTQEEFFHIFNELYNNNKQLVFTSDQPPQAIDGIEERIKTRLQWGLVVDIQRPDLETRIAILQKKAKQLDLFLSDDIFNLIASSIKSSIRELEGSLIKLQAFTDVMDVQIDIETVKELLKIENNDTEKKKTIDDIARATCQYFKIPLADLKSKSRNKDIAKARHLAMYLSRKVINSTQQEIGKYFGGRDHSTVINGVRKIEEQLKKDSALSRHIFEIENLL